MIKILWTSDLTIVCRQKWVLDVLNPMDKWLEYTVHPFIYEPLRTKHCLNMKNAQI